MPRAYSMERRAALTAQTRIRILDATAGLIVARRSTALSIGDVAEAADIAPRTLYNHFPTVDDLMGETMARMTEEFLAVEPGEARPGENHVGAARRILADWFRQLERNADLLEALSGVRDSPAFTAALDAAHQARRARVRAIVALSDRSPQEQSVITSLAYTLTGYAAWKAMVRDEGMTTDEASSVVASTLVTLLEHGLTPVQAVTAAHP